MGMLFPVFHGMVPKFFRSGGGLRRSPKMQEFVPGSTFQEDGAARTHPAQMHRGVFLLLQESLKQPEVTQPEVRIHKSEVLRIKSPHFGSVCT